MAHKPVSQLRPGDVVTALPFKGGEKLPVTVIHTMPARARGYIILLARDASGREVLVPAGRGTNQCEVA